MVHLLERHPRLGERPFDRLCRCRRPAASLMLS
jgi:hypothetical protein